jgi:hypothetical protein
MGHASYYYDTGEAREKSERSLMYRKLAFPFCREEDIVGMHEHVYNGGYPEGSVQSKK